MATAGVIRSELNLLFVDDEKGILDSFSLLVGDLGHRVSTASDADEAGRLVRMSRFDIIFLDQNLGNVRGTELMKILADMDPEAYFVIITANCSSDLAVESLKKGAADFIGKPFSGADIIKSIEYVMKKRELDIEKKEMIVTLEQMVDRKNEELKNVFYDVLTSFAQAMEKRDYGTYGHCRRVSQISCLIAAALDLGDEKRNSLKAAAMLHDIGKIGISDFVLGKTGPLTAEEWGLIKHHPAKGVEILRPIKQFSPILPCILHHHENYDGSGYPHGLAGKDIPLTARIIAIADAYDAILSDRPYRSAADRTRAMDELVHCSGTQFDPEIVRAFAEIDARYHNLFGCN
ncbi:MAG: HD domain-containing protein [Nitrospirae bacterium]|nr:HD domain-containing protein [Nitrospirota bacterium]